MSKMRALTISAYATSLQRMASRRGLANNKLLPPSIIMPGLVPAIHVFGPRKVVDARNTCGHDEMGNE
jgi:hypothetical protein